MSTVHNVKAKFKFTERTNIHTGSPESVMAKLTFVPVWGDGKGNETWSKATPSGKLEMNVTNPAAIEYFELGKDYMLTFEEYVPEPA